MKAHFITQSVTRGLLKMLFSHKMNFIHEAQEPKIIVIENAIENKISPIRRWARSKLILPNI